MDTVLITTTHTMIPNQQLHLTKDHKYNAIVHDITFLANDVYLQYKK